jgi:hypothetical protein
VSRTFSRQRLMILLAFCACALLMFLLFQKKQQQALGSTMIERGDIDGLERLVRDRPSLATTLLEEAFKANKKDIFLILLANKANIENATLTTKWGPYPLLLHFSRDAEVYWIQESLKYGANPNLKQRNTCPLFEAIYGKRPLNAIAIIDAGANLDLQITKKRPYDVAVSEMQFEPAFIMLQKGANANAPSFKHATAIQFIRDCFSDQGSFLVSSEDARLARANEYFLKIVAWYRDRNLDIMSATFKPSSDKSIGQWVIPKFTDRESQIVTGNGIDD